MRSPEEELNLIHELRLIGINEEQGDISACAPDNHKGNYTEAGTDQTGTTDALPDSAILLRSEVLTAVGGHRGSHALKGC